jgi:hypothetical protein
VPERDNRLTPITVDYTVTFAPPGPGNADANDLVPSAVLTKQIWPTRPRSIAMRGGHYADQASAIEAARLQGMEWIAAYG